MAFAAPLILAPSSAAQSLTDFEPAGFADGESVHNHAPDGTNPAPPISFGNNCVQAWFVPTAGTDEQVADLTGSDPAHQNVWRFSQGAQDGSLGQSPHSANSGLVSGESGALSDSGCGAPTTGDYYAQFDFRSSLSVAQPNLRISAAANSGDTRHAFVRILDDGAGLDLTFFETTDGCQFQAANIDANLPHGEWHTLGIEIFFVDGLAAGSPGVAGAVGNDVVNIYLDGYRVHTGTSWESCVGARSVDRILFESPEIIPSQLVGGGLYFDNVLVSDLCPEGFCLEPPSFGSVGECISTRFDQFCVGLTGRDRAECNHEQQDYCFELFGVK